jgi:hypothetical protein
MNQTTSVALRGELAAAGYCSRSQSVTGVLLGEYRAWGIDLPKRQRVMSRKR